MKRFPVVRALVLGLAITATHTLFVCAASDASTLSEAYACLYRWDAEWYGNIVQEGYHSTLPPVKDDFGHSCNVAFFPGFPLLARGVQLAFGLRVEHAVLLASQLACWGFWAYLFLLFERWNVPPGMDLAGAIAVVVHPAAFFLVTGYSESRFLLALLGFIFWSGRRGPGSWALAGVHGFVMSATRIVGLPLAFYPLLHAWITDLRKRSGSVAERLGLCLWPALACGLAVLGGLAFFVYCQWRFGEWNLYMQTQKAGWGIEPDYLIFFRLYIYRIFVPSMEDGVPNTYELSQLAIPVTLAYLASLLVIEWRVAKRFPDSAWQQRVGLYLAAWIMFYLSVCGLKNRAMASVIRYALSVHVMLVLAVVHLLMHVRLPVGRPRALIKTGLVLTALASAALQAMLAVQYTHDRWVA